MSSIYKNMFTLLIVYIVLCLPSGSKAQYYPQGKVNRCFGPVHPPEFSHPMGDCPDGYHWNVILWNCIRDE